MVVVEAAVEEETEEEMTEDEMEVTALEVETAKVELEVLVAVEEAVMIEVVTFAPLEFLITQIAPPLASLLYLNPSDDLLL